MVRALERYPWALAYDPRDGEVPRTLTVLKSDGRAWVVDMEGGGPMAGPAASDVYVALAELYRVRRHPDGLVVTSVGELYRVMGRAHGGTPYQRVVRGLDELARVRVTSVGIMPSDETFALCAVERADKAVRVQWSAPVLAALQQNRGRYLNVGPYWTLKSPLARRLYRYFDVRRWRGRQRLDELAVPLDVLATEVPLPGKYPSQQRRALRTAFDEFATLAGSPWAFAGVVASRRAQPWQTKPTADVVVRFAAPSLPVVADRPVPVVVQRGDGLRDLVDDMLDVFGDEHSLGFYRNVAAYCPAETVRSVLAQYREDIRRGVVSREAARRMFTVTITARARSMNVALAR